MTRRAKEKRAVGFAMKQEKDGELKSEAKRQWEELLLQLTYEQQEEEPTALTYKTTNVPISASGTFELPIQVDFEQATLSYQFHTKEYDICFAISRKDDNLETYILEPTRFDAHVEAIVGSYLITGPTLLYLIWDNEYSWLNSKNLAYSVELRNTSQIRRPVPSMSRCFLKAMADRIQAVEQGRKSLKDLSNVVDSLNCDVSDLQHQIDMLQEEIHKKQAHKTKVQTERENLEKQITIWSWEIQTLGWKSLDSVSLAKVISYGTPQDQYHWKQVNRDWADATAALSE